MRKLNYIYILLFILNSLSCLQRAYGQTSFSSPYAIQQYLRTHISTLSPIEGEWDVDCQFTYDTPFVHREYPPTPIKIWIIKQAGNYVVYAGEGNSVHKSQNLSVSALGETNAYTFQFVTTPCRIYLQNGNHFLANMTLNNESANVLRGKSTAPSVKISIRNDCIKVYPTSSMYYDEQKRKDAERRAAEEKASEPKVWSGTGFALKNGYVVTNYHVVDGAMSIIVQGVKGDFNKSYKATIAVTDKNNDLAILKISDPSFPGFGAIPYSISSTTAEVGEDIFVLGYPLTSTMGDEIKLTTGIISSKTGFQGDVSLYQISAPVQPGNSGGPLFDKKGNVIGIVSSKHKGAENVGYAIKSMCLRNLIESSVNSAIIPTNNSVSTLPLTGKVKAEKNFVFFINCHK